MNRRTRLLALAWSLPDAIHQPRTATSLITSQQPRGPSPATWALCDTCDGDQHLKDRFGRTSRCPSCNGLGRYRVDPYTGQPVASELAPAVRITSRPVRCDRCDGEGVRARTALERTDGLEGLPRCESCDGTGKVSVPIVPDDPSAPAARRDRTAWVMVGDWHQLAKAITDLREHDLEAARVFIATYVTEEQRETDLARAVFRTVDQRMPRRITVPAGVVQAYLDRDRRRDEARRKRDDRMRAGGWRDDRNRRMRSMFRDGHTTSRIAQQLGVSESTVLRVCRNVSTLEAAA